MAAKKAIYSILDLKGNVIQNVGAPSLDTDVATKGSAGTDATTKANAAQAAAEATATSLASAAQAAAITAAITISQPFRLVLEIGSNAAGPTAAGNFRHRIGCAAATDFALTTALTTDLNPWFELSHNLDTTSVNNYFDSVSGRG